MAKKRVTRSRKRELEEPDKFISLTTKIVVFLAKYKTFLLSVAIAIMLIIVAISSFYYYSDRAESKASVMLANCLAKYEKIKTEQGAVKAYQEVSDDFIQIVENNWGKDSAKLATVMYANICYNAGEFDRATELYNKALSGFENNPFVKNLIFNGIAYSREGKKDYTAAVEYFNKILSGPDDKIKDETLFNLGRLYAVMGNKDKSVEAFNKIISDYKDSSYTDLAEEKIFHSL
ncbi:MAG: tetratricopeptide repeat protein [Proteobacteria bacterium]|nr:tetratricopeptide repeat protein [Desulfobacteraceae bacterium]MBU3981853.1 tetratricopeptide repeat protein [Pseudomonadota bacterium]MBU4067568.1 tetratricopeptide repeat protein [Pseudomonadota bacterium]MBU4101865.1 tetratricopeptide repeat protein [Pseudomonadota bacterium]MBU4126839.1 tetratricopeptide repeat protein [Pseudomonadota bacterium]